MKYFVSYYHVIKCTIVCSSIIQYTIIVFPPIVYYLHMFITPSSNILLYTIANLRGNCHSCSPDTLLHAYKHILLYNVIYYYRLPYPII